MWKFILLLALVVILTDSRSTPDYDIFDGREQHSEFYEDTTEEPFEINTQDNSTSQPNNARGKILLVERPTFTESTNYDDETEKTSLYPIVPIYESSRVGNEENNENITDESVKHTTKDNSTHQPNDVGGKNPLEENPTFTESTYYDYQTENTVSHPLVTIHTLSRKYTRKNDENTTRDPFENNTQDNSTYNVSGKIPLEEKTTFTESTNFEDGTEITLVTPVFTIYESSRKYNLENSENTTEELFENKTQDNSTSQANNVSGKIPLEKKPTFTESTNYEEETEKTVSPKFTIYKSPSKYNEENITDESFKHTTQDNGTYQPNNISEKIPLEENPTFTEPTNYEDETEKTVVSPKFTIYESPSKYNEENITDESFKHTTQDNSTHQPNNISEKIPLQEIPTFGETLVPEEIEIPPSKQLSNQTYKLILKRNCTKDTLSSVFRSLNSILNSELNANNGTKLMKCEQLYEFNVTSNIASPETFDEVINLIKEIMSPDMEVIIVNYDSTLYNTLPTPPADSESFVVPKFAVYIASGATIAIILFMIFIICVRSKCRGHSTSLDLSDIPHLTLSVDDYKLPPIPRPSVSFPESNRDFLYSYSNETFTKEDDTVLTQRHFSTNGKKDVEMKTFNARRWAR